MAALRGPLALLTVLLMAPALANALAITAPTGFTATMTVIDYSDSPVVVLAGGTSIVDQYATLGVLHDGSTTTPFGPPRVSSPSGLPGLESPVGDPDPNDPITITFTAPVTQVGAFYLMAASTSSIMLSLFRADGSMIESATIAPGDMPLTPGPYGFNEGFLGIIAEETIATATFSPVLETGGLRGAFVIDDLHFGNRAPVPEPSAALAFCTGCLVVGSSLRARRRHTGVPRTGTRFVAW